MSETTTFTVTVTDGQGCEDTDQVTVNVTDGSTTVTATVPNCTDTYIYEVCQTGKALSHWTLGLPTCLDESDIHQVYLDGVPYSDWEVGTDPTCGTYGLKWDGLHIENECAELKVVFTAGYISQGTDWSGKFATCCSSAQTEGPSCDQSLPVTISGDDQICPGTTTTLTASGGDSYTWSNGANTPSIDVGAGTYSVTATTTEGCSGTATQTINNYPQPQVQASDDVTICVGESTTISASGIFGLLPYSYSWDNGLGGGNSKTVSPGATTSYTVTLTDGNGCTDTDEVTVTVNPSYDLVLTSMCWQDGNVGGTHVMRVRNENDIAITFDVYYGSGGTVEATYTVSANKEYFFPVDDVASVTIKWVAGGCEEKSTTKALNQNPCEGELYIDKVTEGNLAPAGGTYTMEVTDENSNVVTTVVLQDGETSAPIILPGSLEYGESNLFAGIPNSGVPYPGGSQYTVTETDNQGAQSVSYETQTGSLEDPNNPAYPNYQITSNNTFLISKTTFASVTVTNIFPDCENVTYGGSIGDDQSNCGPFTPNMLTSVQDASGGNGSLLYQWYRRPVGGTFQPINGATNKDYAPGLLTETTEFVRYAKRENCDFEPDGYSNIVTIIVDTPPTLEITGSDATCGDSNGEATVEIISGGTAPFTFEWNNGETTSTITSLAPDTYAVTVTDHNGCQGTANVTIENIEGPTLAVVATDVDCNGNSTGAIDVTVTDGTAPFTYNWDNGASTEDLANIEAGSYSLTVTDANGCTATVSKTISEPPAIDISATVVDADCEGNTTGSIDLAATGGTAPYSYSWDNGETTQDISGLAEGTYEVTVTDANNCNAVEQFDVGALPALMEGGTVSGNQSECGAFDPSPITNVELPPADNNGRAIEYIWLSSTTTCDPPVQGQNTGWVEIPDSNSPSFDPGPVTESTCFIRCARYEGCVDYLGESNVITITVNPVVNLEATVTDAACNGDATGAIDLTVSGGTDPFTYAWSNNEDTEDIENLTAGSYTVTVTDANGCTAELTKTVNEPAELSIATSSTPSTCGEANGTAIADPQGGTAPYSYSWEDGQTAPTATGLLSGTYAVTVTDANGCTATADVVVDDEGAPTLSTQVTDVACNGGADGTIDLTVSGGTDPFTYAWSNNEGTEDIADLTAGTYTVTVTDANGCTATLTETVEEPAVLTVSTSSMPSTCGDANGTATADPQGGTAPYSYAWDNGQDAKTATGLLAGTYEVTVTDANSCEATATIDVSDEGAPTLSASVTDVDCFGSSTGAVDVTVMGGTAPFDYSWDNNATTEDLTNIPSGTYSLTITDANGCTATITETVDRARCP